MAKTKRTIKSKQEDFSATIRTRLLAAISIFIIIVTAMQYGSVGETLQYTFAYCFGSFAGIVYALVLAYSIYVLIKAKLPKLKGPRFVGAIILLIGILIVMSLPSDSDFVGFIVVEQYIDKPPLNRGGLIGAIIYGLNSSLFAYMGTLIAGVFCIIIGSVMLGAKLYFQYIKDQPKKPKTKKNTQSVRINKKPYTLEKHKPNAIIDFFTRPDKKDSGFFPDEVFEDNDKLNTLKSEIKRTPPKKEPLEKQPMKIHQSDEHIEKDEVKPAIKPKVEEKVGESKPILETTTVPVKRNQNYKLPPLHLLKAPTKANNTNNKNSAVESAERLVTVLREFGVNAIISDVFIGPSVTKYEIKLETGTRVNKILQLQDDIKLALAARDIRIEAPIPGKSAIGVEIPNSESNAVSFREVFKDIPDSLQDNKLLVPLGKDVSGSCKFAELNKMPHLLIAGATGSGKSVCINTIICSILMRAKPNEVRLILVDPKKVELAGYNGVPHLLTPVCTDPKKAASILREVVGDMERRYDLFAGANVRNIETYNNYVERYNSTNEEKKEKLAYHVVILDEVADLMMVASKDVEDCIMRIAQMARAAGIHLIVATQRPSTDVITGVIKANIPSRIAFAVSSSIDSRTILDSTGAEKLLGKGDMLFSPMGASFPTRVQGAFVSDQEVEDIVYHTKKQQEVTYDEKFVNVPETSDVTSSKEDQEDEEYEKCREFVINAQKASTSLLQRHFRIGYNKAARIIDQLESDGIIGPQIGSKPREVYVRGYNEE